MSAENKEPVMTMDSEGTRKWWQNGFLHRGPENAMLDHDDDLPALISNRYQLWYQHGRLYRRNYLPPIVYADGRMEWILYTTLDKPGIVITYDPSQMNDQWQVKVQRE